MPETLIEKLDRGGVAEGTRVLGIVLSRDLRSLDRKAGLTRARARRLEP